MPRVIVINHKTIYLQSTKRSHLEYLSRPRVSHLFQHSARILCEQFHYVLTRRDHHHGIYVVTYPVNMGVL